MAQFYAQQPEVKKFLSDVCFMFYFMNMTNNPELQSINNITLRNVSFWYMWTKHTLKGVWNGKCWNVEN